MRFRRSSYLSAAVPIVAMLAATCSSTTAPTMAARTLTGNWPLQISASPSCRDLLPFGYGVAPRGLGRVALVQSGDVLTGTLYIADAPSGDVNGTITSGTVRVRFNLNGRNVGTLKPEDEPCQVVGDGTGTTDGRCYMSLQLSGNFACPYSCVASDHIWIVDAGRGCS